MTPQIKSRQLPGDQTRDPSVVELLTYNEKTGARKALNVGASLLPLGNGAGGYTTNASTAPLPLPSAGCQVYVYNSSSALYAVTLGDNTMTAQSPGAVQVGGSAPFVGVPCQPNAWTWVSSGQWNYVATNNAALLVFLVDDPTYIIAQSATNSSDIIFPQGDSGAPVNEPNT